MCVCMCVYMCVCVCMCARCVLLPFLKSTRILCVLHVHVIYHQNVACSPHLTLKAIIVEITIASSLVFFFSYYAHFPHLISLFLYTALCNVE